MGVRSSMEKEEDDLLVYNRLLVKDGERCIVI